MKKPIQLSFFQRSSLTCLLLVTLHVPVHAATRPMQKNRPNFDQTIETETGTSAAPKSIPVPARQPLDFTVTNLPPDSEGARKLIVRRINEAQAVITRSIVDATGKRRKVEDALKLIRDAAATAGADLQQDLNNLLIAALIETEVENFKGPGQFAKFKLWSYRRLDESDPKKASLCGPTIVAHPGTVLLIPVLNLLDKDDLTISDFPIQDPVALGDPSSPMNSPHGFDRINLHTHGLNVSPSWPADDIFREIAPWQVKFYVYHLPPNHPIGTFWYHPHKHGAVATHVAGGMAGALLVSGKDQPAGLDDIAKKNGWGEELAGGEVLPLILQQFRHYRLVKGIPHQANPYLFRPDFFAMKDMVTTDILTTVGEFSKITSPVEVGALGQWMYAHLRKIEIPSQPLQIGEDKTWLSGRLYPTLSPRKTGETYRLRLVHGGIETPWDFVIRKKDKSAGVPLIQAIAWDGIPLSEPFEVTKEQPLILSPGNRAEVLICFVENSAGDYEIINHDGEDEIAVAQFTVTAGAAVGRKLLTHEDVKDILKPELSAAGGVATPFDIRFEDATAAADGHGTFAVVPGTFSINNSAFPGVPRYFDLDSSADIKISAEGHPIHFHVNPLYLPAAADGSRKSRGLPPGPFWTDTLQVEQSDLGTMRFENWTGETVVHCHILDHEDNGMMNLFNIHHHGGFPIAPLPGVLDMPSMPEAVVALLQPAWPPSAAPQIPAFDGVTVYVFLPRVRSEATCAHCVLALNNIAALRLRAGEAPAFRIVAVTGPDDGALPELATKLKLNAATDLLSADPKLDAFQGLALVDGNPIYDSASHRYTFPESFADGKLKHDGDVMHGLFIVNAKGFVVSANRTFRAYDDTAQTLSEIRAAADVGQAIKLEDDKLKNVPAPKASSPAVLREKLNLDRFKQRLEEFKSSAK